MVKSTCCSGRGPRFSSQYVHGGSQPPVMPVPGNLTGLCQYCVHGAIHTCKQNTYTHKSTKNLKDMYNNNDDDDDDDVVTPYIGRVL